MIRWLVLGSCSLALVCIAACGGSSATHSGQTAEAIRTAAPAARPGDALPVGIQLPGFPLEKSSSGTPPWELNGVTFTEQQGGIPIGTSLLLNAPAAETAWAVYALASLAPGQQLTASTRLTGSDRYWLAVADFSSGRWSFSGPHADDATMPAPAPAHVSGQGKVYAAIVVIDAQAVAVDGLRLELTNPHPAPIFGMDPRHTGRSSHTGPQTADLARIVESGLPVDGSAVIDNNGTLYSLHASGITATNPDGSEKWKYALTNGASSDGTAIAPDGRIYFVANDGQFTALNPDGSISWQLNLFDNGWGLPSGSLTIGIDGNIYFGAFDGYLYAFSPEGSLLWSFDTGAAIYGAPAQDGDCSLYVGNALGKLFAVDSTGEFEWSIQSNSGFNGSSAAIGDDGAVYIGNSSGRIHALNPDGSERWTAETTHGYKGTPALAADSTVYVIGSQGQVLALDPQDGAELWSYELGHYSGNSPAVDAAGTIYVGDNAAVAALRPDGSELWRYNGYGPYSTGTPAISPDGMLCVPTAAGMFIFGPGNSGPPEVSFSMSHTGANPYQIMLDASATSDEDGIQLYAWTFDGGFKEYTSTPVLIKDFPNRIGNLSCELTVYDGKGVFSSATHAPLQLPTNWNMLGGNGLHTGLALGNGPAFGAEAWWFDAPANVRSSPAIAGDGTIYFGCDNGYFYAYNPDGTEKWKKNIGFVFLTNSPAVGGNGTVYFAAQNNELHAVNPEDGSEYWTFTTDAGISTSIALSNVTGNTEILFGCIDGQYYRLTNTQQNEVYELDKYSTNGNEARTTPLFRSPPMIGLDNGEVHDIGTGLARFTADAAIRHCLVGAAGSSVIFGSDNGTCYSLTTTEPDWTYAAGSALAGSPAFGPDGSIHIATTGGKLIALDSGGAFRWEVDHTGAGRSAPVVGANGIIYCAFGNLMYSYNPDGSERWSYDSFGPIYSSPAIDNSGRLVFGSDDDVLLVLGSN
ncbi:MAG: PQQ-binding-like beta-propeller repeat protein [bacterium]